MNQERDVTFKLQERMYIKKIIFIMTETQKCTTVKWNEHSCRFIPLLSCGEQASYFKPDFYLCSPFETAAAAFLLLLRMLSEATFFRDYFPPFQFWKIVVRSNNTIYTDGQKSVAFLFKRGKQQQIIRKNGFLCLQMSPLECLMPLEKQHFFSLKHN